MSLSIYPAPWPRDAGRRDRAPIISSTNMWPRAPRRTKSCTECQRRKQKPCSHCKRRFPEPVCEYGPLRASKSTKQIISISPRPLFAFPVSLPGSTPRAFNFRKQARPLTHKSPRAQAISQPRRTSPSWSQVPIATEQPLHPVLPDDEDDEVEEVIISNTISDPGQVHLTGQTQAVQVQQRSPRQYTQNRSPQRHDNALIASSTPSPWLLAGPLDAMGGLPIAVNKQNAMLIHTFGEVLYHLKGSFDGVPDHDNPFLEHYVPWCVQSPLLVYTSLYISAQPLAERHYLDDTTTMRIKIQAIHVLNEYLRSTATDICTGDEAMGAVTQFISIELYYGTPAAMLAHLHGFRKMVLLRGGFAQSRVGALVTKTALVGDALIALCLEVEALLQPSGKFPFAYDEPPPEVFHLSYSSPLLSPRLPFGTCVAALGLHPATAWLLDEMAFLINAVLSLPRGKDPEEKSMALDRELAKLRATAAWTLARIEELPVDSPDAAAVARNERDVKRTDASRDTNEATEATTGRKDGTAGSDSSADCPPTPHSLLPRYPKFSASDRPPSPPPASTSSPTDGQQPQHPPAGPLYTAVRLTACLYTRAILERKPFSEVCSDADALAILAASWRVPLDRWRGVLGIFVFVMAAVIPTLHQRCDRPDGGGIYSHIHTRFAKSILQIGLMNVALVDWPASREMMGRSLQLQRWLREGQIEAATGSTPGL